MKRILLLLLLSLLIAGPVGPVYAQSPTPAAPTAENRLDLNTATADQLKAIKGIGPAWSKKIIAGRPYKRKDELVSRGIMPQGVYDKIKDVIIARQPK